MLEIFLLISLVFLIYAFFYKQSTKEYLLNQIDFEKMDKLYELLSEKNPIILKNAPPIPCVLPQTLLKTPRFSKILADYLEKRDSTLPHSDQFETFLANETGFQTFGEHAWFSRFHTTPISEYISSIKSRLSFGSKNLQRTYAFHNVIIPISGKYICSLVNSEYEKSLPKNWMSYTTIESIVSEKGINYIDIILKPGSILILPAHWYYIMKEEEPFSYYGVFEYHEPISSLSELLEKRSRM